MKKLIGIAILLSSLALAIFILRENKPVAINTEAQTPFETLASIPETLPITTKIEAPAKDALPEKNITLQVSQQIAEEFLKKNPNGPDLLSGENFVNAIEPEKLVENLVSGKLGDEALADFNPVITATELNLIPAKDKEALRAYLEKFNAVIQDNAGGLNVDFSNPTAEDFDRIVRVGEKTIAAFYALPVPPPVINIHKEELRLLTIQRNIFRNISNYANDPLRAWVSIEMYQQNEKEFAELKQKIADFVKTNNLGV